MDENENKDLEVKDQEVKETEDKEVKDTYTKEEVEKLIQSEADKRVTQALKKAEKDKSKAIEEAKKLADMNAEEKAKYELDQKMAEYDAKLKELSMKENLATCTTILTSKGLDAGLAKFVVADDAETMNANIKEMEKLFIKSVGAEVDRRLTSPTPKTGSTTDRVVTKEIFDKMTTVERFALMEKNPKLYEQLSK